MYYRLPLTEDKRQVMTADAVIDGAAVRVRFEMRYLAGAGQWVISMWDNSNGEMWVNMIPLICSRGAVNDLLRPFRHKREGRGIGSLIVLPGLDQPEAEDPGEGNLGEYMVIYGDTYEAV